MFLARSNQMSFRYTIILTLALLVVQTNVGSNQASPGADSITVRFDYAGAEALLDAIDRSSLTDDDVMKLLEIRGVKAMVDNVTRYRLLPNACPLWQASSAIRRNCPLPNGSSQRQCGRAPQTMPRTR